MAEDRIGRFVLYWHKYRKRKYETLRKHVKNEVCFYSMEPYDRKHNPGLYFYHVADEKTVHEFDAVLLCRFIEISRSPINPFTKQKLVRPELIRLNRLRHYRQPLAPHLDIDNLCPPSRPLVLNIQGVRWTTVRDTRENDLFVEGPRESRRVGHGNEMSDYYEEYTIHDFSMTSSAFGRLGDQTVSLHIVRIGHLVTFAISDLGPVFLDGSGRPGSIFNRRNIPMQFRPSMDTSALCVGKNGGTPCQFLVMITALGSLLLAPMNEPVRVVGELCVRSCGMAALI